jgi:hypothetical protein
MSLSVSQSPLTLSANELGKSAESHLEALQALAEESQQLDAREVVLKERQPPLTQRIAHHNRAAQAQSHAISSVVPVALILATLTAVGAVMWAKGQTRPEIARLITAVGAGATFVWIAASSSVLVPRAIFLKREAAAIAVDSNALNADQAQWNIEKDAHDARAAALREDMAKIEQQTREVAARAAEVQQAESAARAKAGEQLTGAVAQGLKVVARVSPAKPVTPAS